MGARMKIRPRFKIQYPMKNRCEYNRLYPINCSAVDERGLFVYETPF